MEKVVFFGEKIKLDLTKQFLSFQENNSRLNNKTLTKFVFPFKYYVVDEVIRQLGDLRSPEFHNVEVIIPGTLLKEGSLTEAKLYLLSMYDNELEGEIDYGLEEIPNFEKKLSELPLERFPVDDIHVFAKQICEKTWPATNFNFPRIYSDKYPPTEEMWDAYDGYYNDLKPDGTEMRRNYLDENLNIFNVNIIHPCPHAIYLLQAGFGEKGYTLEGDILTDEDLYNRWVFSGTQYFKRLLQDRTSMLLGSYDHYEEFWQGYPRGGYYGRYRQSIVIEKAGDYNFTGQVHIESIYSDAFVNVYLNNVLIHYWRIGKDRVLNIPFSFSVGNIGDNSELRIEAETVSSIDPYQVFKLEVIGKNLSPSEGEESSDVLFVTNPNEIDLTRAVPEMTFGEYVNRIINWFNYELEVVGKKVIMNRLDKKPTNIKDFRQFEFNKPKRKFQQKKSFLIRFAELDKDVKLNSMYFDYKGQVLNGLESKDTNIIEIDGYCLPVELAKPNGYTTAVVKKDSESTLSLVGYDGLKNGQNNAVNPPGCHLPELFDKNWLYWLQLRVSAEPYEDTFLAPIDEIAKINVKDYIFWQNNIHQIASWNKQMLSENLYKVSIQTETII